MLQPFRKAHAEERIRRFALRNLFEASNRKLNAIKRVLLRSNFFPIDSDR
jgi:hypothetical protein